MNDDPWSAIAEHTGMLSHDFSKGPFALPHKSIKAATQHFKRTSEKEVRVLCYQTTREDRPSLFRERGLFLLPTTNSDYMVVRGDGYVDIPAIARTGTYQSKLDFELDTSKAGDSESQHVDFAFASSLIRTFVGDDSLVLTIRGRKRCPQFSFRVGNNAITANGVQTEVDAGYEGRDQVVLVEAKNAGNTNTIIRQLFYPFRQWKAHTKKPVMTVFFQKDEMGYSFWQFRFRDVEDYNSIELVRGERFMIALRTERLAAARAAIEATAAAKK
jgi:hypothetical protein